MRIFFIILLSIIILFPCAGYSDGMVYTEITSANLEVKATAQRAALWLRNGTWEMHIQPVFPRNAGKAAWVVPFPVMPTIELGSIDFFDELEILTAPIFLQICSTGSSGGCDSAPDSNTNSGQSAVDIWQRGVIGDLDYVIISADEGSDIVNWLRNEGYEVTVRAELKLRTMEAEGQFFFAAKLVEDADPEKPLAPVRFVLPGMDPQYPLRTTSLGVLESARLALTLWVIMPYSVPLYVPESHPYDVFKSRPATREEYNQAINVFYLTHTPDTFLLLHHISVPGSPRISKMVCPYYGMGSCISFEELGIQAPENWCPEIEEMNQNGYKLSRYQARLSVSAMASDLMLAPLNGSLPGAINVYEEEICDTTVAGLGVLAMLLLGIIISLIRRKRS